jgi:putative peptide zinc metalloprotease protein
MHFKREAIYLAWSFAAWTYRFLLFLGITLLVYNVVFKALGIVLIGVEID